MKLKFPKYVVIGDTKFEIIQDPKRSDAEFFYWDTEDGNRKFLSPKIIIGTEWLEAMPTRVLNSIIHELKEIIQIEQGTRWYVDNNSCEFHYNHKQHSDLCSRLAGLLEQFLD
ncbi:MAG: hypothetical protein AB1567_12350 [bacterium]